MEIRVHIDAETTGAQLPTLNMHDRELAFKSVGSKSYGSSRFEGFDEAPIDYPKRHRHGWESKILDAAARCVRVAQRCVPPGSPERRSGRDATGVLSPRTGAPWCCASARAGIVRSDSPARFLRGTRVVCAGRGSRQCHRQNAFVSSGSATPARIRTTVRLNPRVARAWLWPRTLPKRSNVCRSGGGRRVQGTVNGRKHAHAEPAGVRRGGAQAIALERDSLALSRNRPCYHCAYHE